MIEVGQDVELSNLRSFTGSSTGLFTESSDEVQIDVTPRT
jgi:hypothetical protein